MRTRVKKHRSKKGAEPVIGQTPTTFSMDAHEAGKRVRMLVDKGLLSGREIKRMKDSFSDFLGLLFVFNQALHNVDILEPVEKKKKQKVSNTVSSLCLKYLGSTMAQPVEMQMPEMELEILLHNIVEEGVGQALTNFSYAVELPYYKLRRRGRYVNRIGIIGNAKKKPIKKHWAVFVDNSKIGIPNVLLFVGFGLKHETYLLAYHLPKTDDDTLSVHQWIQETRSRLSPFRGNICMWDYDGFQFNMHPRRIHWSDIIPNSYLVKEFDKCLHMLKNPQEYRAKGISVKRGLILAGPPGTGKTVHLECLISDVVEARLPVFQISNTIEPTELSYIYNLAEQVGPSLVILDDVDTITAKRSDGPLDEGGHSGNVFMLNTLLSVLDGSEKRDGVITVATTNHPQALDRALANRPGRFDRTFRFPYPSKQNRLDILTLNAQRRNVSFDPATILKNADEKYQWILTQSGVTPSHLAEVIESVVRDATKDDSIDQVASFLEVIDALKATISVDERFVDKEAGDMGFIK